MDFRKFFQMDFQQFWLGPLQELEKAARRAAIFLVIIKAKYVWYSSAYPLDIGEIE